MFTKTLKQLWDEVEAKAEQLYIDLESPEMVLLNALAERCHQIEIKLGFVADDSGPGEPAPGEFVSKFEQSAAGPVKTATDLVLATAGQEDPGAGGQGDPGAGDKKSPVWDGHRHV